MADLSLELFLEKSEFVHGESIRFVATLMNRGPQPEEILSPDRLTRALSLSLMVAGDESKTLKGDAMRLTEREGDKAPHVRSLPTVTLAPGQKVQATGDVLAWIGAPEPGEYMVRAEYAQSSTAWADSTEIAVKVVPAHPAAAFASSPCQLGGIAPRLVTWLNGMGVGLDLFLEKVSTKAPSVTVSNRPLTKVPFPEPVRASCAYGNPPAAHHVTWIENGNVLKVLRLPADKAPEAVVDVPLPVVGLDMVGDPFSDAAGGLSIVLATSEGDRAMLVKLPPGGKPTATPINPRPAMTGVRDVFWSREEHLFLVWTEEDGTEILGATTSLATPANPLEGRRLITAPQPVASLKSYQAYDARRDAYDLTCAVLCHNLVLDLFNPMRFNLATAGIISQERFEADGLGDLTVIQAEVDAHGKAAYLMRDPEGAVYYGPPDLSSTKKIILIEGNQLAGIPEVPMTVAMHPHLIAANAVSSKPGFYLRFIRDGSRFETRKM